MRFENLTDLGHEFETAGDILVTFLEFTTAPQGVLDDGVHCGTSVGVDRERQRIHVVAAVARLMIGAGIWIAREPFDDLPHAPTVLKRDVVGLLGQACSDHRCDLPATPAPTWIPVSIYYFLLGFKRLANDPPRERERLVPSKGHALAESGFEAGEETANIGRVQVAEPIGEYRVLLDASRNDPTKHVPKPLDRGAKAP